MVTGPVNPVSVASAQSGHVVHRDNRVASVPMQMPV